MMSRCYPHAAKTSLTAHLPYQLVVWLPVVATISELHTIIIALQAVGDQRHQEQVCIFGV